MTRDQAPPADLAAFYARTYARLVGVVGAITQDRSEAEEAVQEAFVRLVGRWRTVAQYDDPEAWVRKVALGVASNRRRKVRNGWRALARHGPPPPVPEPSGSPVDLARALAALSRQHREVLVLQDLGLSLVEIGRQLDVPVGTVKSRLARARAALAPLLREDADDHV